MNYSVPVPTLNNRTADLLIGMTVGGSSAVNGQFFDRASRLDYDDWDYLAGEVSKDVNTRWNWDSLLPYFKKVSLRTRCSCRDMLTGSRQ